MIEIFTLKGKNETILFMKLFENHRSYTIYKKEEYYMITNHSDAKTFEGFLSETLNKKNNENIQLSISNMVELFHHYYSTNSQFDHVAVMTSYTKEGFYFDENVYPFFHDAKDDIVYFKPIIALSLSQVEYILDNQSVPFQIRNHIKDKLNSLKKDL